MASFGIGCVYAWSSPVIAMLNGKIEAKSNPLQANITSHEESWIASLCPLGATISPFISGYLSDRYGRKKALLMSSVPMITGFLLEAFATHVAHFYAGRFLNGLALGTIYTVLPIYVGEIAEDSNRGRLGCFYMNLMTFGNLYAYSIGPFVTIRTFSLTCLLGPALFLASFGLFVPESPYHLVAQDKMEEAEAALLKLRHNDAGRVGREMPAIRKNVEESFAEAKGFRDLFADPGNFRAICIMGGLAIFQQFSGINVIFFYMQSIFEDTGSSISSNASTIVVNVVQFAASATASTVVERLGRKLLLVVSAVGCAVSLLAFGAYFHLKDAGGDVRSLDWLPIVSIVAFIITYSLGLGPVTFTILGEIFPPNIKSVASSVTIMLCLFSAFCTTTFFPHVVNVIGMSYTFWTLAGFCMIALVFILKRVPETKGKNLEEIQVMLKN